MSDGCDKCGNKDYGGAPQPYYVMTPADRPDRTHNFTIPDGCWARVVLDEPLPEGEKLCLMQRICVCGKAVLEIPVCLGGGQIGIKGDCTQAVIPIGGEFFFEYTGTEIESNVVVIPHCDIATLQLLMSCGDC